MKFTPKFIAIALILVSLIIAMIDFLLAIQRYEELRREAHSPCLEAHAIGREEERFLEEVKSSWIVLADGQESWGLVGVGEIMWFDSTIEGFVQALTHEVPPFPFGTRNEI